MKVYTGKEITALLQKAKNIGLYLGVNSPLEKLTLGELDTLLNKKEDVK